MRLTLLLFFTLLVPNLDLYAQNTIISGRVIDENFETIPEARIQNSDTVLLGTTNLDGKYTFEIPAGTDTLLIGFIAMEWKTIKLPNDCDTIDIVLMYDAIYDFMTPNRIDRLRMKRFKKLPDVHKIAFEKGLFLSQQPCYDQSFVPIKKRIKEIHRQRRAYDDNDK